ncbi:unnamed protein product [Strongylus vulgaris]|uniref:Uncharacterized protein n=1 Tax=Strongylus vulgaris TaxID=40348 RepID=A0A3P7JUY1_STRVU|nr:unnamed protein product [Strongylus vulgaris]
MNYILKLLRRTLPQVGSFGYYNLILRNQCYKDFSCIAVIFRFLFFNRHVGVLYSCLSISHDGKCDERAIYVISRHETIDHAELIVLEKVAKAVCVDPHVLYHTATFGMCCFISEITKLVPLGENVATALSFNNRKQDLF